MSNKLSDQWQTPQYLFEELDKEFNFDIDLCATKDNSKCDDFCTDYLNDRCYCISEDHHFNLGLAVIDWCKTCFMNPPHSNPKPFIEKAWEDSKHCKIVCLVKCDPSTKWWGTFWEYGENTRCLNCNQLQTNIQCECGSCGFRSYYGPKPRCAVRFFPKRIQFDPPFGLKNSKLSGPTFSSALLIFDRKKR